jgi:hypothetical protein
MSLFCQEQPEKKQHQNQAGADFCREFFLSEHVNEEMNCQESDDEMIYPTHFR